MMKILENSCYHFSGWWNCFRSFFGTFLSVSTHCFDCCFVCV